MPRIPGLLERIQQPLYDTLDIIPSKREYLFFQEPYSCDSLLTSDALDFDALSDAAESDAQCPLCKDILINKFETVSASMVAAIYRCDACSTFYHRSCTYEMRGCATMGCKKKGMKVASLKAKPKTIFQTNMESAGSIPYPKSFEIHGFDISFDKTADQFEVDLFKEYSLFQFIHRNKEILTLPLVTLEKTAVHGIHPLAEPIDLIPQTNFLCKVSFFGPKTINSTFHMRCTLHGFFRREVH